MEDWTMYGKIQELKQKGFKKTPVSKEVQLNLRAVDKYWDMSPDDFAEAVKSSKSRNRLPESHHELILGWLLEHPNMMTSQIYDWLTKDMVIHWALLNVPSESMCTNCV